MSSNNQEIRTYPSKGLIIFLSVVIFVSLAMSVVNYFVVDNLALKITLWVFFAIFFILSLVVLLNEAINYVSFNEESGALTIHKFIIKKKIQLTEISRIDNIEGFYIFYKDDQEIYRLGTQVKGVNTLIVKLERCGIKIKW